MLKIAMGTCGLWDKSVERTVRTWKVWLILCFDRDHRIEYILNRIKKETLDLSKHSQLHSNEDFYYFNFFVFGI